MRFVDARGHLDRIQDYSAGIFGFAATLLVLNLSVPPIHVPWTQSFDELLKEWPKFAVFALSFVSIGQIWVSYRRMFACFRAADQTLLWLNIALLLFVVTLPFFTGLVGTWASDPVLARIAAAAYGSVWAIASAIQTGMWRYASSHRKALLRPEISVAGIRRMTVRLTIGPVMYAVFTIVAAFSFYASMAGFVALTLFYMLPHAELDPVKP